MTYPEIKVCIVNLNIVNRAVYVTHSLRLTSGATPADLLAASMAAELISSTYLRTGIGGDRNWDLLCRRRKLYQRSLYNDLFFLFFADSHFIIKSVQLQKSVVICNIALHKGKQEVRLSSKEINLTNDCCSDEAEIQNNLSAKTCPPLWSIRRLGYFLCYCM